MANPVLTFFTLAAADRKWSIKAVLGVSDGGNRLCDPRAVLIRPENTYGTRETVMDNYVQFADKFFSPELPVRGTLAWFWGEWISAVWTPIIVKLSVGCSAMTRGRLVCFTFRILCRVFRTMFFVSFCLLGFGPCWNLDLKIKIEKLKKDRRKNYRSSPH